MIKKIAKMIILSVVLLNFNNIMVQAATKSNNDKIKNKANALRVSNDYITDLGKEKFDSFWTPENEQYLSESQKSILLNLKEKVNKGEILSSNEKTMLKDIKVEVIKKRLGEEKFNELEKLVNKRDSSTDLTLPERNRLYKLDKELRGLE
jgi:hypothetical protein